MSDLTQEMVGEIRSACVQHCFSYQFTVGFTGRRVTEQSVFVVGDVAVKILKVTDPTPEQFQAFRNEVAVLR